MSYQTLLFDVDDTLLDFQSAERQALNNLFRDLELPLDTDTYQYYHELNESLWRKFEVGQLTRPEMLVKRFHDLFVHVGHPEVDFSQAETVYRNHLAEGHDLEPEALQLVLDLSQKHDLYIVTNGVAATQQKRLDEANIAQYFQQVFISEIIGAQKPELKFFEQVAANIVAFDRRKTLVIGDSLTSDIKGANGFDLDSVWFNPLKKPNESGEIPTFEIDHLLQLETIVA